LDADEMVTAEKAVAHSKMAFCYSAMKLAKRVVVGSIIIRHYEINRDLTSAIGKFYDVASSD
jgi:hypothetical protein